MTNHSNTIHGTVCNRRRLHSLRLFIFESAKASARILTFAAIALLTCGLSSPWANAQSHLNQAVSTHVVLVAYCSAGSGPCIFKQQSGDGSMSSAEFRIPSGQALVVTDVQYLYGGNPERQDTVGLVLWRENLSTGTRNSPWWSLGTLTPERREVRDNMTAGFVVNYGAHLLGEYQSNTGEASIVVRGYLIASTTLAAKG
jgi:hypothetical protein